MGSGNGEEEEWGQENDARTPTIVGKWWGKSPKGSVGSDDDGGDSGWGYGQGTSECKRGIDRRGSCSDNGPDGDRSGMLDDNGGEWMEGEPARDLRSTKI